MVAPFCDSARDTTVRVRFPGATHVTAVVADPTSGNAVVATSDDKKAALSVVDARTCAVEATVRLRGLVAHDVAVEPGARAYVSDGESYGPSRPGTSPARWRCRRRGISSSSSTRSTSWRAIRAA
jgi:hypothetical protein